MSDPLQENGPESWGRLMALAQNGDHAAYDALLRAILPYVRGIVRRHHASPDRVEDVLQDVLLTVHRVRQTYDPGRSFANWLGAIAHRRSIDALRRKVRIQEVEAFAPEDYETFADPAANRETQSYEDGAMLTRAIATLPAGQRQAVELLKLRELSLAEASLASGQSVAALKVSLHRAMRTLKARLGPNRGAHGGD